MGAKRQLAVWLVNLALIIPAAFARNSADTATSLVVRVTNDAQVPTVTLRLALIEAGNAFRQAGIELLWRDDSSLNGDVRALLVVDLKLVRREEVGRWTVSWNCLGFAQGSDAYVLFSRVERAAQQGMAPLETILGHAAAHELGHVLLGRGHQYGTDLGGTSGGLMRGALRAEDWRLAERGRLTFTARQADAMRAEIERRFLDTR